MRSQAREYNLQLPPIVWRVETVSYRAPGGEKELHRLRNLDT